MRQKARFSSLLVLSLTMLLTIVGSAQAVEPNKSQLAALKPFGSFTGVWKGEGAGVDISAWQEKVQCVWGYRESDGRVSINFHVEGGAILKVALLTYDAEKKLYRFIGKTTKDKVIHFEGTKSGSESLTLDRVGDDIGERGAADKLDRLELKSVRLGDKVLLTFGRRKGRTLYEQYAQIELFREGPPMTELLAGTRCVVTEGPGLIAVSHGGKNYLVVDEPTKKVFLAHPNHFLVGK
ncbi:hypothetical protein Pan216_50560 [Planctomycetes bacterium Pan216]|uniref:Uncharacterized protein n=1 Tax=Kolteria novifilia TaxID=2527975 RepID=A0A518BB56_9BACT|nr:hypothetical protein Pan216_50560 [Planctomycetes bacterium Pan216]